MLWLFFVWFAVCLCDCSCLIAFSGTCDLVYYFMFANYFVALLIGNVFWIVLRVYYLCNVYDAFLFSVVWGDGVLF